MALEEGKTGATMIKIIKSEERHHTDMGWLSTYWHFSFSDYYDGVHRDHGWHLVALPLEV